MKFTDFKFVYIDNDYLKTLHDSDAEIFYVNGENYKLKPHLGLLITNDNFKYVIPLTSAKPKHLKWKDVTSTNYRIYEIIDIRKDLYDKNDIIADVRDLQKLRKQNINEDDFQYYKQRILSVLEIKKMFPVVEGVYTIIDLSTSSEDTSVEQRRMLMQKEYFFCRRIMADIERKAHSIYEKQIITNEILPYHCNYKLLESVAKEYIAKSNN